MSKHEHDKHHADHGRGAHAGPEHRSADAALHKDWRAWAVVLLMLAAMAVYVLSEDESLAPGEPPQAEVPAAEL